MRMAGVLGCAALLGLGACAGGRPSEPTTLTMPPADGRDAKVTVDSWTYVINRQARGTPPKVDLRVTRFDGRDLDYSDGRIAKRAAEAYCAGFNRSLDPSALGRFSVPNSWVFKGDCL